MLLIGTVLFLPQGPTRSSGAPGSAAGPEARDGAPLEVVDLRKRIGGLHAVAGLSMEMAAGEIVRLIGPNGAGKTTLFHLISRFAAPDRGEVRF